MNKILLFSLLAAFSLPMSLMGSLPNQKDYLIKEIFELQIRVAREQLGNELVPLRTQQVFDLSEDKLRNYKVRLQMILTGKGVGAKQLQSSKVNAMATSLASLRTIDAASIETPPHKRAKLIDESEKKNLIILMDEAAFSRDRAHTALKKELPKADVKVAAEANDKKRKSTVLESVSTANGSAAAEPAKAVAKEIVDKLHCGSIGCLSTFGSRGTRRAHWINIHKIPNKLVSIHTQFSELPEKVKEEALQYNKRCENKRRVVVSGWKAKKVIAAAGNAPASVNSATAAYNVQKIATAAANTNSATAQARAASAATDPVTKPAGAAAATQPLLPANHNQSAIFNVTQTIHTVTHQHVVYGVPQINTQAYAVQNSLPLFNTQGMNYPAPVLNAVPSTQMAAAAPYPIFQAPVMAQQPAVFPTATSMPTNAISERDKLIAEAKLQLILQMVAGGCNVRLVVPFVQALNL